MANAANSASVAPAISGRSNRRSQVRQPAPRGLSTRVVSPADRPSAIGIPINIQPAKWFLLMKGPNGWPICSERQKP